MAVVAAEEGRLNDTQWVDLAITAANRVGILSTIFASTQAQRERLREALSFVFAALA